MKMIAAKEADQYLLRLPEGLREQIKHRADANGRSMNTEIVDAIINQLQRGDKIDELERRLAWVEFKLDARKVG